MPDNRKHKKILRKNAESVKNTMAEDLICVPRPLFEQMQAIIKGMAANGGRSRNLLDELAKLETTK